MTNKLNNYFKINELGSTIRIEILAGVSTFLSMAYIFVVNPSILAQAGMDKSFVLFATIIASALATIVMGLWAKLPFSLAPGLEMNAYVAFVVVAGMGFTWQQGLGIVFWSGMIFILLTIFKIRESIIDSIPAPMKSALSLSVGVFLILIATNLSGVLTFDGIYVDGIGDLLSNKAIALYIGIAIVFALDALKVRATVLISIILVALYCNYVGIFDENKPAEISTAMFKGIGAFDISVILEPAAFSAILILFMVDFYGSIAKFIGLTLNTSIVDKNGKVPRTREALSVDGVATIFGSFLGTTSVTTYVESGVGIGAGGRTGLTSIVCGILMLLTFIFVPFIKYIPVVATAGALVYVGVKLFPKKELLKSYNWVDIAVSVIMPILVIFTFSLEKAMFAGFLIYTIYFAITLKKLPNIYLVFSTLLLLFGILLQYFGG